MKSTHANFCGVLRCVLQSISVSFCCDMFCVLSPVSCLLSPSVVICSVSYGLLFCVLWFIAVLSSVLLFIVVGPVVYCCVVVRFVIYCRVIDLTQVFCQTTNKWLIIDNIFPRDVRDCKPDAVMFWEANVTLPLRDEALGELHRSGESFTDSYCPFLYGCSDGVDHDPLSSLGPFCPNGCSCLWCSIKARKAQDDADDALERKRPSDECAPDTADDHLCGEQHPLSPRCESSVKRQKSQEM